MNEDNGTPKNIVHGIRWSVPLCEFTRELSGKWENGDGSVCYWDLERITCEGCRPKARELTAGIDLTFLTARAHP